MMPSSIISSSTASCSAASSRQAGGRRMVMVFMALGLRDKKRDGRLAAACRRRRPHLVGVMTFKAKLILSDTLAKPPVEATSLDLPDFDTAALLMAASETSTVMVRVLPLISCFMLM